MTFDAGTGPGMHLRVDLTLPPSLSEASVAKAMETYQAAVEQAMAKIRADAEKREGYVMMSHPYVFLEETQEWTFVTTELLRKQTRSGGSG
jgi:hypothetical protein